LRYKALAKKNFIEVWRDPLALALTIGLPAVLLLVLQAFKKFDDIFKPASLTPGIVLFGYVMLMFSAAMTLSRDRESALFHRLLTAPVRSNEFVAGYSIPYLPVALIQALALFGVGIALGMRMEGIIALLLLVLAVSAIVYIGLGMIIGAAFSIKVVPFAYTAVLLLTIFGGAWMDLEAIGGVFEAAGSVFPFAHGMAAMRSVIIDGAGVGAIAEDLYWLAGYSVGIGAIAVLVFRRRMLE
jgi:ABC-2 type transport system permease protein